MGSHGFSGFLNNPTLQRKPQEIAYNDLSGLEGRYGSGKSYGKAWSQYQETPKVRGWERSWGEKNPVDGAVVRRENLSESLDSPGIFDHIFGVAV